MLFHKPTHFDVVGAVSSLRNGNPLPDPSLTRRTFLPELISPHGQQKKTDYAGQNFLNTKSDPFSLTL